MSSLNHIKLAKLTITAYISRTRNSKPIGKFEAMFNPEEFSQKHEVSYQKPQGIHTAGKKLKYSHSPPRDLNIKLILDGTSVDQLGILNLKPQKTVAKRVKQFIDLTYTINGTIREPNFLVVNWGSELDFSCRLGSVNVSYTSFDRDGSPLRAVLDATFIFEEDEQELIAKTLSGASDLIHSRLVKSGDTLPLLTKEIYGSSADYLRVAQINNLDNFRALTPGQGLIFPPLTS